MFRLRLRLVRLGVDPSSYLLSRPRSYLLSPPSSCSCPCPTRLLIPSHSFVTFPWFRSSTSTPIPPEPTSKIRTSTNIHPTTSTPTSTPTGTSTFTLTPPTTTTKRSTVLPVATPEDRKPTLRTIEVDEKGNYRQTEYSKAELARQFVLQPRDLRVLDASLRNIASILPRKKAMVVNLDMFRALISADRLLIFDPWPPNLSSLIPNLRASLDPEAANGHNGDDRVTPYDGDRMPYEFMALEYILIHVCDSFDRRFATYSAAVEPLLTSPAVYEGTTLKALLPIKYSLASFAVVVKETRGAVQSLLDSDEDMAEMYLGVKRRTGHRRRTDLHQEMELLLETYLRKLEQIENEVNTIMQNIASTENLIQVHLDSIRNNIMKADLLLTIGTLGVGTTAMGASIFGMNVPNMLEASPYAFPVISGTLVLVSLILIRKCIRYCLTHDINLWLQSTSKHTQFPPHYVIAPHTNNTSTHHNHIPYPSTSTSTSSAIPMPMPHTTSGNTTTTNTANLSNMILPPIPVSLSKSPSTEKLCLQYGEAVSKANDAIAEGLAIPDPANITHTIATSQNIQQMQQLQHQHQPKHQLKQDANSTQHTHSQHQLKHQHHSQSHQQHDSHCHSHSHSHSKAPSTSSPHSHSHHPIDARTPSSISPAAPKIPVARNTP